MVMDWYVKTNALGQTLIVTLYYNESPNPEFGDIGWYIVAETDTHEAICPVIFGYEDAHLFFLMFL